MIIIISFFTLNLERLSKELTIKLFKADVIIERRLRCLRDSNDLNEKLKQQNKII